MHSLSFLVGWLTVKTHSRPLTPKQLYPSNPSSYHRISAFLSFKPEPFVMLCSIWAWFVEVAFLLRVGYYVKIWLVLLECAKTCPNRLGIDSPFDLSFCKFLDMFGVFYSTVSKIPTTTWKSSLVTNYKFGEIKDMVRVMLPKGETGVFVVSCVPQCDGVIREQIAMASLIRVIFTQDHYY